MNIINYFWNFNLNEKKSIPLNCINYNKKYIKNYKIIRPNDILPLLTTFDKLSELWKKIPHKYWVVKADIARLLYIYHFGGLYLDVDCIVMKDFSKTKIHINKDLFLFVEDIVDVSNLGPRECKNPENSVRIANYAFYSKTIKNEFLELCLKECIKRLEYLLELKLNAWSHNDILWVCGPDVITTMYHKNKDSSIKLFNRTFIRHLQNGSWR